MKYNYINKHTNRFITVLKRSGNTPRFGMSFSGYGLDPITTKYIKVELLKSGNLYNTHKAYFDQYKSKLYVSKDKETYSIFMIPIEEFIQTELTGDSVGYRERWYNYNEVNIDRGGVEYPLDVLLQD